MKMIGNRLLRLVLVGMALVPLAASADLQDALDGMFYATGNEPTIYQSQRRLGLDGGTLRLRAPMSQFNLVNMTPPTFRAGCGGIDMYGGSFTFINQEQFRQLLRQIGANAIGYAFKLALSSMCGKCDSILTGLRQLSTNLNKMQVDSCRWAQGLVNDLTSGIEHEKLEKAKTEDSASGFVADGFEAIQQMFENPGEHLSGGDPSGADPGDVEVGNITWNALTTANVAANFTFVPSGNINHNELLMNIAGTLIMRAPTAAEPEEGSVVNNFAGALSYDQLRNGRTAETGSDAPVHPMYFCPDQVQCLDMTTDPAVWDFDGVDTWVLGRLQAAADHMGNPATANAPHVADLQNFLGSLPFNVARDMQWLQGHPDALAQYVDVATIFVTQHYASTLALDLARVVRASFDRTDTPDMPPVVAQSLDKFEADAKKDRQAAFENYPDQWSKIHDTVERLSKHIQPFDAGKLVNNS